MLDNISRSEVFGIASMDEFNEMAMKIFHYQAMNNEVYREFISNLDQPLPEHWTEIPCIPISAFKHHKVYSGSGRVQQVFTSSGTTGSTTSSHYVLDLEWYRESFERHFHSKYGDLSNLCILGLLPSYLEREGSSLVLMVKALIEKSGHDQSGFYLNEFDALRTVLHDLRNRGQKTVLIGVSFALLDFCEKEAIDFPELIVMETGGMKGRRKELIREELHDALKKGYGVPEIHSEYGMTELLSQAYSTGEGMFYCPPWMKVTIRDVYDPLGKLEHERTGGLNIIDLANVHSCSFICTDDLGKTHADGSFEVLGRFDQSDIRGCSLMV